MENSSLLKTLLVNIVQGMDNGSFACTPEKEQEAIRFLSDLLDDRTPMSKYAAAKYLHISKSTFDRYVSEGRIPKGRKLAGFNELIWYKKDLKK